MHRSGRAPVRAVQQTTTSEFVFKNGFQYAEKDEYIAKALTFEILAIDFEKNGGYESGQDRWLVHVLVNDGRLDKELLSFGTNPARDEQFRSAQAFIESNGPIKDARLEKRGNAYYIVNAAKSTKT
jgi:hypothetical protein